jgi:hypothetical protein
MEPVFGIILDFETALRASDRVVALPPCEARIMPYRPTGPSWQRNICGQQQRVACLAVGFFTCSTTPLGRNA